MTDTTHHISISRFLQFTSAVEGLADTLVREMPPDGHAYGPGLRQAGRVVDAIQNHIDAQGTLFNIPKVLYDEFRWVERWVREAGQALSAQDATP